MLFRPARHIQCCGSHLTVVTGRGRVAFACVDASAWRVGRCTGRVGSAEEGLHRRRASLPSGVFPSLYRRLCQGGVGRRRRLLASATPPGGRRGIEAAAGWRRDATSPLCLRRDRLKDARRKRSGPRGSAPPHLPHPSISPRSRPCNLLAMGGRPLPHGGPLGSRAPRAALPNP